MKRILITIDLPDDMYIKVKQEEQTKLFEDPIIEQPLKRGRGRPKGSLGKGKLIKHYEPVTEPQAYTLKTKLHYMDDQIAGLSKNDAQRLIGEFYQVQPKNNAVGK